ncbi:MAG: response regulator [Pseudomonadota bacterium]
MKTEPLIPILMVDDEVDFLDATSMALSRRGFSVITAVEGSQALALLAQHRVSVVILDVRMPGMDGVELCGRLKMQYPDLPVVLLTGHGNVQQAFQTSREGVFDYLLKPCEVEKLAEVARRAAAHHAPHPTEREELDTPIRLLFVDDETDFLESLSPALERRGMEVTPSATPDLALSYAASQIFDVALVDMKMPGMDGMELSRRLRLHQPLLEIVVLTGHPTMGQAFEAIKQGAFDFLMKPLSVEAITAKVRQANRQAQRRREADREAGVKQILDNKAH